MQQTSPRPSINPWRRERALEARIAILNQRIVELEARAHVLHAAHEAARLEAFHNGYAAGLADGMASAAIEGGGER